MTAIDRNRRCAPSAPAYRERNSIVPAFGPSPLQERKHSIKLTDFTCHTAANTVSSAPSDLTHHRNENVHGKNTHHIPTAVKRSKSATSHKSVTSHVSMPAAAAAARAHRPREAVNDFDKKMSAPRCSSARSSRKASPIPDMKPSVASQRSTSAMSNREHTQREAIVVKGQGRDGGSVSPEHPRTVPQSVCRDDPIASRSVSYDHDVAHGGGSSRSVSMNSSSNLFCRSDASIPISLIDPLQSRESSPQQTASEGPIIAASTTVGGEAGASAGPQHRSRPIIALGSNSSGHHGVNPFGMVLALRSFQSTLSIGIEQRGGNKCAAQGPRDGMIPCVVENECRVSSSLAHVLTAAALELEALCTTWASEFFHSCENFLALSELCAVETLVRHRIAADWMTRQIACELLISEQWYECAFQERKRRDKKKAEPQRLLRVARESPPNGSEVCAAGGFDASIETELVDATEDNCMHSAVAPYRERGSQGGGANTLLPDDSPSKIIRRSVCLPGGQGATSDGQRGEYRSRNGGGEGLAMRRASPAIVLRKHSPTAAVDSFVARLMKTSERRTSPTAKSTPISPTSSTTTTTSRGAPLRRVSPATDKTSDEPCSSTSSTPAAGSHATTAATTTAMASATPLPSRSAAPPIVVSSNSSERFMQGVGCRLALANLSVPPRRNNSPSSQFRPSCSTSILTLSQPSAVTAKNKSSVLSDGRDVEFHYERVSSVATVAAFPKDSPVAVTASRRSPNVAESFRERLDETYNDVSPNTPRESPSRGGLPSQQSPPVPADEIATFGSISPYVDLLRKASRELHELRSQRDALTALVERLSERAKRR